MCRGEGEAPLCPLSSLFLLLQSPPASSGHVSSFHSRRTGRGRGQRKEPLTRLVSLLLAKELPGCGGCSKLTPSLAALLVPPGLCIAGNLSPERPLVKISILGLAFPSAPWLGYSPSLDGTSCPTCGPSGQSPLGTTQSRSLPGSACNLGKCTRSPDPSNSVVLGAVASPYAASSCFTTGSRL